MRLLLGWWGFLLLGLLFQTTFIPALVLPPWRPDITRALVFWLALTGRPRGGALLAFAAGLALDLASGAPLGFTAFLRLLVYGVVRPLRGVFFEDHPLLLVPLAAVGAALDGVAAAILAGLVFAASPEGSVLFGIAWRQALVDVLWVPMVFIGLELVAGRTPTPEVPA